MSPLTPAQVPANLVKHFPFGIHLGGEDALMFLKLDGTLFFEPDGGPLTFGNERPWQPVHIHAEIMQPSQKYIGGHRARLQDFQQQFARRLNDDLGQ
jgi:hypothetical protein